MKCKNLFFLLAIVMASNTLAMNFPWPQETHQAYYDQNSTPWNFRQYVAPASAVVFTAALAWRLYQCSGKRIVPDSIAIPGDNVEVQRANTAYKTFWDWKARCDTLKPGQTALTLPEFKTELATFTISQQCGPLAVDASWVDTQGNPSTPTQQFLTQGAFEPYVQKLDFPEGSDIAFHGDIHGDIHSFNAFIEFLAKKGYLDPQDPFKITKKNFYIMMLGDYTDRGNYGAEVVYAIMRFKRINPSHFFMVRGNHEDISLNNHMGFTKELNNKFGAEHQLLPEINKMYNYLPMAIYVASGPDDAKNALLCCHGGLEFGFMDTRALLNAPGASRFCLLNALLRKTRKDRMPSHQVYLPDTHCDDYKPTCCSQPTGIGFLWNDFEFVSHCPGLKTIFVDNNRGWILPEGMTKVLLAADSTPTCTLRGVFRAHQHNSVTMNRITNKDKKSDARDAGVAKLWIPEGKKQPAGALWDGIVCTFCVSPGSGYGSEYKYNFDAFGILTVEKKFEQWRLAMHRIDM